MEVNGFTVDEMISHKEITKEEFKDILDRYPGLIESIAESKPAKNGQKPLPELDRYRFVDAPNLFAGKPPRQEMKQQDVKTLVEWKLRHGKYRPTLMGLISSNPADLLARTIQSAIQTYRTSASSRADAIGPALNTLIQLKGVGSATASLLLAVHDPLNVMFFSDEAFHWLCGNGGAPLKYNLSEYFELSKEAESLAERLGVSTLEIEKVAYVLVKQQQQQQQGEEEGKKAHKGKSSTRIEEPKNPAASEPASARKRKASSQLDGKDSNEKNKESKKRKERKDDPEKKGDPPVRRSQRLRK